MSVYEYSSNYYPLAPICQIYLGLGGSQPTLGPLEALMDTGSDMSIIPIDLLKQIGAKRISRGRARSVWGDARSVDIYIIALALEDLQISTLQVLADDQGHEIVIGRPVLNRLKMILDGPAAQIEIVDTI